MQSGWLQDDDIFIGISIPQLFEGDRVYALNEPYGISRSRELYILSGIHKYLQEDSFIEFSMWIKKKKFSSTHIDFNTRYYHRNSLWGGVGYSTSGNMHFECGWILGPKRNDRTSLKIGYGYDLQIGNVYSIIGNSHEINISYSLDTKDH
jgi:hypothetical protein